MKPKQIKDHFVQALKNNDVLYIDIKDNYFMQIGTYAEKDLWNACLGETDTNENGKVLIQVERDTWESALEGLLFYIIRIDKFSSLLS